MSTPAFQLEVAGSPAELRLAFREVGGEAAAVQRIESLAPAEGRAAELSAALYAALDRSAAQSTPPGYDSLDEPRRLGRALWEALIPPRTAARLRQAPGGHLTLLLDEALIGLPWELLHDGQEFLCRRFALGRIVRTGQSAAEPARRPGPGRSLLILANPTGDLPGAQAEQERIRAMLRARGEALRVRAKSLDVDRAFVLENLPQWDALHFSGHVQFEAGSPERSGLVLRDGVFSALDLQALTAAGRPVPAMIYINGCASSRAEDGLRQLSLFNLSNGFLLAGVRLFVGTVADVPDELATELAARFYAFLLQGLSAGEALRQARQAAGEALPALGSGALSYLMYGDPAHVPLALPEAPAASSTPEPRPSSSSARLCSACGRPIMSRIGAEHQVCQACQAPICVSCWTARGLRHCRAHSAAPAAPSAAPPASIPHSAFDIPRSKESIKETVPKPPEPNRCARCGQVIGRGAPVHTCEREGCAEPVCDRCWRWLDRRTCTGHDRPWPERVAEARGLLAAGQIPLLVDRRAAAQRESFYFGEIRTRLERGPALLVDGERFALLASSVRESTAAEVLQPLLARVSDGPAIAAECPQNPAVEAQFRQAGLLGTRAVLSLKLEVLSDLERQVYPGYETAPRGAKLLEERIAQRTVPAGGPKARLIHVLASVTRWDDEARRLAVVGGGSELRQESGRQFVLVDLESDEVIHSPAQPLPAELLELIRPSARLSVAAELEVHIRATLTAGEFLTAGELAEQFRISPRQVRMVFEALVGAGGGYELREVPEIGLAITKKMRA